MSVSRTHVHIFLHNQFEAEYAISILRREVRAMGGVGVARVARSRLM